MWKDISFRLLLILFGLPLCCLTGKVFADGTGQSVVAVPPKSGSLVAQYKFEGNAADTSGVQPAPAGILVGSPTYDAGPSGQAICFDGDDYVNCGNRSSFNLTSQLTVTAWIKVNKFDKEYQTIISKGDNSWRLARAGKSNSIEFACNGTAASKWNGAGEVPWAVSGTTDVNDGKWHHIAGVFDGSALYLYVDGVLEAAKAAAKSIDVSNYDVCIGANAQAPGRYWNGLIDDVRIYDYALSQAEIASTMGESQINLSEPALVTFFNIAKRYDGLKKCEEAKGTYQLILNLHPDSSYADSAQVYISKRNILSLIKSKDYADAQEHLDNLVADFNDHPDLPEALFSIAQEYSEPRKFDKAEALYRQIALQHPGSPYAEKARFNWPKLHIFSLLKSGNYAQAEPAIEKFVTDFLDQPATAGVLFWFAKEIEAARNYQRAKDMYNRVILLYPDNPHALQAELKTSQMDILALMESGDEIAAQAGVDALIADFNDHPDLPEVVFRIGEEYYYRAVEADSESREAEARVDFAKAAAIWERILQQWPDVRLKVTAEAFYFSATCYRYLGEFKKAGDKYRQFAEQLPKHAFAIDADYYRAICYCCLGEYEKAKNIYLEIIKRHPNTSQAQKAEFNIARLDRLSLSNEDRKRAVSFFEAQHRNWLAIQSCSARYRAETQYVSYSNGVFSERPDGRGPNIGTVDFVINPVNDATSGGKLGAVKIRIYNEKNKCGFVKGNALISREAWRQWTDDASLPVEDNLKEAVDSGLAFFPLDMMARTYPNRQWNNVNMMPKQEFLGTRGIPVRRSTQQETDEVFDGEPQYLFMASHVPAEANYWFSARNGQLRQIDFLGTGGTLTSYRYEDYVAEPGDNVEFPRRFVQTQKRTWDEGNKASLWRLIVELTDLKLNVDISPERFAVK